MVEQSESSADENQSANIDHVSINNQVRDISENNSKCGNDETLNSNTLSNRFSIFRWFKRSRLEKTHQPETIGETKSSSSESVDTFYSTATVKSFAFHSAGTFNQLSDPVPLDLVNHNYNQVGPFGSGAAKVGKEGSRSLDVTRTLPAHVLSRKKKDIASRYSLQNCSVHYGSCDNLAVSGGDTRGKPNWGRVGRTGRKAHVRGKRKAPDPPVVVGQHSRPRSFCGVEGIKGVDVGETDAARSATDNSVLGSMHKQKQRRPAPQPPNLRSAVEEKGMETESSRAVGTKTLGNSINILQGQVRSQYKENSNNKTGKDAFPFDKNQQSMVDISNDTLVLQGGYLLPKKELTTLPNNIPAELVNTSTAMPRPWYKRSVFENSVKKTDANRGISEIREELDRTMSYSPKPEYQSSASSSISSGSSRIVAEKNVSSDGKNTLSKLNFFHRNIEEKRKDTKRRSGLSILSSISELDKEAAAIVQEEQAKTKALLLNKSSMTNRSEQFKEDNSQEVIQDIVTASIESSPRRGTRALISKFNAIGNITKITVNSNFFTKNPSTRDPERNKNDIVKDKPKQFTSNDKNDTQPDLSKYFPQKNSPKTSRNFRSNLNDSRRSFLQSTLDGASRSDDIINEHPTREPEKLISDVTNRLSMLQTIISRNSQIEKSASPVLERSVKSKNQRMNPSNINPNIGFGAEPMFSSVRTSASVSSSTKPVSSAANQNTNIFNYESSPKVYRAKKNLIASKAEAIQKEFSDIFEKIDKQLNLPEIEKVSNAKIDNRSIPGRKPPEDEEASSKVSKVLDILVQAEKNLDNGDSRKPKTSRISNGVTDQMTTDLKEMLKEMKYSLPKRPKPKKNVELSSELRRPSYGNAHQNNLIEKGYQATPSTSSGSSAAYALPKEESEERQKVSSGVQTSGNVRKIIESTSFQSSSSSAQSKHDDMIYRTSGRSKSGSPGLVKNTFQLMRPREFAAIKAIKTLKNREEDNTYANVMEQSLYANALVLPSRNHRVIAGNNKVSDEKRKMKKLPIPETIVVNNVKVTADLTKSDDNHKDVMTPNMNTLAVNRLLKKLEASIANGNHQQAAGFAKELARLKIQCSVVRQRPKTGDIINLDMYIEDRLAHQGPIPLQLPIVMTVKQLKDKICNEFEIPANVQRWIIGKVLADNDNATLNDLKAANGSPVFLYLVAPDLQIVEGAKPIVKEHTNEVLIHNNNNDDDDDVNINNEDNKNIYEELTLRPDNNDAVNITNNDNNYYNPDKNKNEPHLPDNNDKKKSPMPVNQLMRNNEIEGAEKINTELQNDNKHEALSTKDAETTKQYTQLMMLENCEIVSNVDPIECPICFAIYGPLEGVVIRDCLHSFCRSCIENTIKYCNEAEVKCPFRDSQYACESTLQEREIKALVNPQIYEQHLAKSVAQAENNAGHNAFHCKTPDCHGWCIYDDNVNNFLCPVCNRNNCLTCRVIHEGKNCFEYQEDVRISKETDQESKRTAAMLSEMLRRGEAMACPTCDVVLMKKMGCDWLRCSMCKTEICWVTKGPRWGPGGNGDTSGGCKCGQNGVKCHPCCNYCH